MSDLKMDFLTQSDVVGTSQLADLDRLSNDLRRRLTSVWTGYNNATRIIAIRDAEIAKLREQREKYAGRCNAESVELAQDEAELSRLGDRS